MIFFLTICDFKKYADFQVELYYFENSKHFT